MSNRQDRQGVRTPADVERKYNLGGTLKGVMNILERHEAAQKNMSDDLENMTQEFWQKTGEMEQTVNEMKDDFEVTKKEVENTADEMKESLKEIEALEADMTILANWTDGTRSGVAGFVARADEDSTTLALIAKYEGEGDDEALAAFKVEVANTYATIESLTSFENEVASSLAGIRQEATATYATIASVTALDTKTSQAIAGVRQEASETYATIASLASFEGAVNTAIAGVRQEATNKYATIEAMASLESKTNTAIAGVRQEASATYATITSVASLKTETNNAIAGVDQKVTAANARIDVVASLQTSTSNALAGFQSDVAKTYALQTSLTALETATSRAIASVRQEVSDGYAKLSQVAEVVDKYGNVTTASIITAINDGKSSIDLNAERINVNGDLKTFGATIGGWHIADKAIYHHSSLGNCMGMIAEDYDSEHPFLWAGYNGTYDDLYRDTDPWNKCNFYVSPSGRFKATSGMIGSFNITPWGLAAGIMKFKTDGIHFEVQSGEPFMYVTNTTLGLTYGIYLDTNSNTVKYSEVYNGGGGEEEDDNTSVFTFDIDDVTYYAVSYDGIAMTWEEWCESSYNTDGYICDGGQVLTTYGDVRVVVGVSDGDEIAVGGRYTLEFY